MTAYLIKVILCSALLFAVYKLLFENEKMLRFNRVYLLSSIVFSFLIPLITLPATQILPVAQTNVFKADFTNTYIIQNTIPVAESNVLPCIMWSVYITITALLLVRFGINLRTLIIRISKNPAVLFHNAKLVLIDENLIPHSFLNCIFINAEDYKSGKVEEEILLHELTHVQQKHSFDILFIELVQALFWFNPILIFYKKAILLNHEFLADERVINTFQNTCNYQHLLIKKSLKKTHSLLTNSFNYLITKKRLIMMTKSTSAVKALGRQMVVVPLSAAAIFLFSSNSNAQNTESISKSKQEKIQSAKQGVSQEMLDEYARLADKNKLNIQSDYKNLPVVSNTDRKRLEAIFFAMNKEQQAKQTVTFAHPAPTAKNKLSYEQFTSFENPKKYAITIDDEKVTNNELKNYQASDFANFAVIYLAKTNSNYGKHLPLDVYLTTNQYDKTQLKSTMAKDNIMITSYKSSPKSSITINN